MTVFPHTCSDAPESYSSSLIGIELDDTQTQIDLR
jgi:hypothetical protein